MSALRVLPWALHMLLEYLAGIFLVVSPFAFGYTDSPALPVLLLAGVIVLGTSVLGRGSLGVFGILPVWAQAVLEYAIAFALMVAPFAFGFRDEADALLVSVMTGLGLLVVSLLTRYPQPPPAPAPAATPATPAAIETAETARQPDPELPEWAQGDDDQEYEKAGEAEEDWRDAEEADATDEADADRRG